MFVRKRVAAQLPGTPGALSVPSVEPSVVYRVSTDGGYEELKREVHSRFLDESDATRLNQDTPVAELTEDLRQLLTDTARRRGELIGHTRLAQLLDELLNEILGLGPLEPLLADPAISEIMVNSPSQVYVERNGRIMPTGIRFDGDRHLLRIIDRIVSRVGRHIDEGSPMCDARLPDGSRINAIIPPLALNGPCLTIRRFAREPLLMQDLIARASLTDHMAGFLRRAVEARLNIVVSGGTGSGKTTFLNVLSSFVPERERLVTIEDAAELQLQQPHVIRLETRQSNAEGAGAVTQADLLRNTLRMRPDRILVGEVRGSEAFSMLQAMNTGHEGSMTTVHANNCRDALARLETMVLMAGMDLPHRAVREQVASALNLIVQVERLPDGRRCVTQISELMGLEGETYVMQDLFSYMPMGLTADGSVVGRHVATGIVPQCQRQIEARGLSLPLQFFQEG